MSAEKLVALQTLNLLRAGNPVEEWSRLKAASIAAFPLEPLWVVKDTPRFQASFAIECLIRSIAYRENPALIERRHAFALKRATWWLECES